MEITNFYLIGHSYGGFLAGHYAIKYRQHIKKVILMSPVGIRKPKEFELKDDYEPIQGLKNLKDMIET